MQEEKTEEKNSPINDKPKELSLIELKAVWYDLLVQKQQIEIKMNEINNLIAQQMNKQ